MSTAHSHEVSGASAPMPPSAKMSALFAKIDSSGTGSITKDQLESAFATQKPPKAFKQMGVDALFQQLDPSGTGSVTKDQFVQKMTSLMSHFRNTGANSASATNLASLSSPSSTLRNNLSLYNSTGATFEIAA